MWSHHLSSTIRDVKEPTNWKLPVLLQSPRKLLRTRSISCGQMSRSNSRETRHHRPIPATATVCASRKRRNVIPLSRRIDIHASDYLPIPDESASGVQYFESSRRAEAKGWRNLLAFHLRVGRRVPRFSFGTRKLGNTSLPECKETNRAYRQTQGPLLLVPRS